MPFTVSAALVSDGGVCYALGLKVERTGWGLMRLPLLINRKCIRMLMPDFLCRVQCFHRFLQTFSLRQRRKTSSKRNIKQSLRYAAS